MADLTREVLREESDASLRDRLAKYRAIADVSRGSLARIRLVRLGSCQVGLYQTQALWPMLRQNTVEELEGRASLYERQALLVEDVLRERGEP